MKVADIINESVVDGPGLRMVVFAQGCPHRCPECHNPSTWAFDGGHELGVSQIADRYRADPLLQGLTLSGGEPFCQAGQMADLAQMAHADGLDIWTYTGYTFEQLVSVAQTDPDIARLLAQTDVLVDGLFEAPLRDLRLVFRGSSNQRIIDMRATRITGEVTLVEL